MTEIAQLYLLVHIIRALAAASERVLTDYELCLTIHVAAARALARENVPHVRAVRSLSLPETCTLLARGERNSRGERERGGGREGEKEREKIPRKRR